MEDVFYSQEASSARMSVAYHFSKDWDTTGGVYERIHKTYDGPLSLAEDFIPNGTWDEVDEVLEDVYEEAREALGREFQYPKKDGDKG